MPYAAIAINAVARAADLTPQAPAHTLRLILGDQLNPQHSWFDATDAGVVYVLMEVREETDYVLHHAQKILAIFAAMRVRRTLAAGRSPGALRGHRQLQQSALDSRQSGRADGALPRQPLGLSGAGRMAAG